MSTVLVFNPIADLTGDQTDDGQVTLSWTTATRILELINLGAESGNVGGVSAGPPVGWTDLAGNIRVRANQSGREPPEGLNIFDGGTSTTSRASQRFSPLTYGLTIDQIDNDTLALTVDWWAGTFIQSPFDEPKLLVHFYDEDMVLISTHDSGFKTPITAINDMRWDEFQETPTIPVGTRWIDIELWANRRNGSNNDAAFDDIRLTHEDGEPLPYVPGYAIYQDGIIIATAPANATEYVVTGLADGSYEFKIAAYDADANFLSVDSNTIEVNVVPDTDPDVISDIYAFNDEAIYTGYLGGKLRGKTIACPGNNANSARKCGTRERT